MGAWKPVPPALAARFDASLPGSSAVERRKMFGCPCAFVNGNMFAGLHEENLIVRLPEAQRAALVEREQARPFAVMGRTMREYVAVTDALGRMPAELKKLIRSGFDFASGLPPKAAQPRKKKTG